MLVNKFIYEKIIKGIKKHNKKILLFLGYICIISSSIIFLNKLHYTEEIKELSYRDENITVLTYGNGDSKATIGTNNINYYDEKDKEYKPIDNKIVPVKNSRNNVYAENKTNFFKTEYFKYPGYSIKLNIDGKICLLETEYLGGNKDVIPKINDNIIYYKKFYDNKHDVYFIQKNTGIEANVTVNEYVDNFSYDIKIKTDIPFEIHESEYSNLEKKDQYLYYKGQKYSIRTSGLLMYDANDNEYEDVYCQYTNVTYKKVNDGFIQTVSIDFKKLKTLSPNLKFPIRIDPTVNIDSDTVAGYNSSYLSSTYTKTPAAGQVDDTDEGSGKHICRAYMLFNFAGITQSITSVSSAILYVNRTYYSGYAGTLYINKNPAFCTIGSWTNRAAGFYPNNENSAYYTANGSNRDFSKTENYGSISLSGSKSSTITNYSFTLNNNILDNIKAKQNLPLYISLENGDITTESWTSSGAASGVSRGWSRWDIANAYINTTYTSDQTTPTKTGFSITAYTGDVYVNGTTVWVKGDSNAAPTIKTKYTDDVEISANYLRLVPVGAEFNDTNSYYAAYITRTGSKSVFAKKDPPITHVAFWGSSSDIKNLETFFAMKSSAVENDYVIWTCGKDAKGNYAYTKSGYYKVDATVPTTPSILEYIDENNKSSLQEYYKNDVKVYFESDDTRSGVKEIKYKINNGTEQVIDSGNYITLTNEGTYTISAYAIDFVNYTSSTKTVTFTIDKTKPNPPTITVNPNSWTNGNVTVSITSGTDTGSGVSKTEYKIGATDTWKNYTGAITISTEGQTTIYARTIDKAGNVSDEVNATAYIDKTKPNPPTITVPTTTTTRNITVSFSSLSDNLSGVNAIRISNKPDYSDGTDWVTVSNTTYNQSYTLPQLTPYTSNYSTRTLYIQIKDNAGNIYETTKTVTYEALKPSATITTTNDSLFIDDEPISIQWNYSDPNNDPSSLAQSKADIIVKNSTGTSVLYTYTINNANTTYTIPTLPQGTYKVQVKVYNLMNKENTSNEITIRKDIFKATGLVVTKEITSSSQLKWLEILTNANIPTGTSLTCEILYPPYNSNSKITTTIHSVSSYNYVIQIPVATNKIRIRYILNTTDSKKTPKIYWYKVLAR